MSKINTLVDFYQIMFQSRDIRVKIVQSIFKADVFDNE